MSHYHARYKSEEISPLGGAAIWVFAFKGKSWFLRGKQSGKSNYSWSQPLNLLRFSPCLIFLLIQDIDTLEPVSKWLSVVAWLD